MRTYLEDAISDPWEIYENVEHFEHSESEKTAFNSTNHDGVDERNEVSKMSGTFWLDKQPDSVVSQACQWHRTEWRQLRFWFAAAARFRTHDQARSPPQRTLAKLLA